ncbi:MAG: glycosyltransferase [Candidatus Omnitrophica bacterium]|nr:glycosyltransferase [Candidatus Omnitrophota bacterium]
MYTKTSYKISFIIASIDRDEQLQKCIASIEKAHEYESNIPIEILVVIQKAKQKKDIQIRYPEVTTFYYIDEIGLSVARNFAIQKSSGDYLVFLDDDAEINEDFIEVLSKKIKLYGKINAFCGRLIDRAQNIPFSPLFYTNKVKKLNRMEYQYFMGSAHVLSKKIIERIKGYDERFGFGSKHYRGAEETDMFFRLKVAKEQVIYLPDLIFFHPMIYPSPQYVYNYGFVLGVVVTKHCIYDKAHFFIYFLIILEVTMRGLVRLLQKLFLKRIREKDQIYHYGNRLKGLFKGVKCFIYDNYSAKKEGRDD